MRKAGRGFPAANLTLGAAILPWASEPQHADLHCPACTLADGLVWTWSTKTPWETAFPSAAKCLQHFVRQWNEPLCNKHWEKQRLRENLSTDGSLTQRGGRCVKDTSWTMASFPLRSVFGAVSMLKENHSDELLGLGIFLEMQPPLMPHASCSFMSWDAAEGLCSSSCWVPPKAQKGQGILGHLTQSGEDSLLGVSCSPGASMIWLEFWLKRQQRILLTGPPDPLLIQNVFCSG